MGRKGPAAQKRHRRVTCMMRALELAARAMGKTCPNPHVGAVIVKDGKIIGEGYHERAGKPHAEIMALRSTKQSLRGAELYVTLEPCAHQGRTPPCVDAILKSGITTVYAATKDPHPLVNGKGISLLKKSGVAVNVGICRRQAQELNADYFASVRGRQCSQE